MTIFRFLKIVIPECLYRGSRTGFKAWIPALVRLAALAHHKTRSLRTILSRVEVVAGMTVFMLSSSLFAANKNVGTSGATFLKIGAGARPTAMGDAFVGIADDVNAAYFNPAGLGFLKGSQLTAMHTQYIQGLNYDFGAFVLPSSIGSFGVSAITLKADDLEKRDENETSLGSFESLDAAYGLSYAKALNDSLSIGGTARVIRQEIDNISASAYSADLGVLHKFKSRPLSLGFAVRHIGSGIKFQEESDPLPLTMDGGVGSSLLNEKLKLGFNLKKVRDNDVKYGLGTEWNQPLRGDFSFAVRGGYNSSATDADGTTGITLGAGLGYRTFNIDFAWIPMGDLGDTFRYAALFKF